MTRKRRLKRRSRLTQRGVHRKSKRSVSQRGGTAQKPVINLCTGLPHPVNGLEYTTKTEEIVKGQPNPDYKSYFDSNCKPLFYVSTNHSSKSALAKFMILKNPQKVSIVVNKWITLLEPIKAQVIGSSKLEMVSRTNVNPFMDYYAQLQRYKSLFENKSMMSTRSGTNLLKATMTAASTLGKSMDTEALYSDETIMETFNGITQQYKYYSDMPFNMKEFLGFEGIGGWLGTEASRKKSMEAVDSEVTMLQNLTNPDPQKKEPTRRLMQIEKETKIKAAKTALVLSLYVFCYLNYMPIPKGKMDEDTINRMIQTLNKFYEQINTFSGGGSPEGINVLLTAYVDGFVTNLKNLKTEMEKKRAKPIVGGARHVGIQLERLPSSDALKKPQLRVEASSTTDTPTKPKLLLNKLSPQQFNFLKSGREPETEEEAAVLARLNQKTLEEVEAKTGPEAATVVGSEAKTGPEARSFMSYLRPTPESAEAKEEKALKKALKEAANARKADTEADTEAGWRASQRVHDALNYVKVTNENVDKKAAEIAKNKRGIIAATEEAEQQDNKAQKRKATSKTSATKMMKTAERKRSRDTGIDFLDPKERTNARIALKKATRANYNAQLAEEAIGKVRGQVLKQINQDSEKTEQAAKDYKPVVPTISVEKKSGKYAIAEKALREAINLYNEDKNDIHEKIVTAQYKKLSEIVEEDIQTAEKQKVVFPEKYDEKVLQKNNLQKELEEWTDYRGEEKDPGKFNPDELDGKILTLKISIQENKKELEDIKKKIPNVFELDPLVEQEKNAYVIFEKAQSDKRSADKTLAVKSGLIKEAEDIRAAEKDYEELKNKPEPSDLEKRELADLKKTYEKQLTIYYSQVQNVSPGNRDVEEALEKAKAAKTNLDKEQAVKDTKTKEVDGKVSDLKKAYSDNTKDIDKYDKLLRDNASKEREIKKFDASSKLQRDFLSETLSYEKTIAYLYRPKDTRDPLKEFYAAINIDKVTKTVDELYMLIVKTVKDPAGKDKTEDPLDGNENVSYDDLKTFIQSNEGENKMRARTHFFMKVVYGFAKDLHKMIKHTTMTGIGVNDHTIDNQKFSKNRLKEMKEYLKEMARGQTLFSFYPNSNDPAATGAPPANPGDEPTINPKDTLINDYKFVRLYNSTEYKQASLMFSLKEAKLEHVFENTAYFKDRGFVFIKDPAKYMGMFVKYYYDENDYLKGETLTKPTFEEKEETKEADKAYEELGGETTMDKVGKTLKGMNYAGTGTSGQIVSDFFDTDKDTGVIKSTKTAKNAIYETTKSIEGVFSKNKEKAAQELEKKQENALRKQQIMNVQTGGAVEEPKKFTWTNRGHQGVGVVTGLIASGIALAWLPTSIVLNIIINPVKIAFYPLGKALLVLFDQVNLLNSSSYKSLGTMAETKSAECKKVVKMLAMNCEQEKDQRANQLLLSILSNIYNAVDYIEKAEEKFRDRHEYQISEFKPYIEKLVSNIKKDPVKFGEQSLYKSMNEPKKMLYFVYAILQKCKPKTLADAKKGKIDDIDIDKPSDLNKKEIDELQAKINEINEQKKNQDAQITKINELKGEIKTFADQDNKRRPLEELLAIVSNGTSVSVSVVPLQFEKDVASAIAKADKKISENQKEIAKIEGEKKSLDKQIKDLEAKGAKMKAKDDLKIESEDLDKDISEEEKTAAQTLKKNEKPIKELLKKNPPINFDMKEPLEMFKDPKTYLYTRYSGITSGKEMSKTVTLMDGVDMLVPTHLPAAASVFVYKTGQKDETQLAKEAEAKEAADKKAVLAQANAERKSKEAIAKTQAKSAAAATVKAAQIASQGQIRAQVPRGQNPRGPDKGQNRQNRQNRPQTNTVTKTRTQRVKNAVTNVTRRVTQGVKNATVGVAGKIGELLGRKPRQVCVNDSGTETCLRVTMKNDKIMIDRQPRQA